MTGTRSSQQVAHQKHSECRTPRKNRETQLLLLVVVMVVVAVGLVLMLVMIL